MFRRAFVLIAISIIAAGTLRADDQAQAELRFAPASNAERNAGIWVDGHYIGYVSEFNANRRVMLLPGMHTIVLRQAWYEDYVQNVLLEPGTIYEMRVSMVKDKRVPSTSEPAELKISVTPSRAAVFVDRQFAGHADEFDGIGRAMLIAAGQHKLSIALPGYVPVEVVVNVRAHQKLRIKAELQKGSITEAGVLVSPE